MISLRYYLDTRKPSRRPDGKFPLKIAVTKRGDTYLIPVLAYATREEWDAKAQRLKGGRFGDAGKTNQYLAKMMMKAEDRVRELMVVEEAPPMTAAQIRDAIAERILDTGPGITLGEYYDRITKEKKGATRLNFENTRKSIEKAVPRIMERPLSSINVRDVEKVDSWLRAHLAPNTRNSYIAKLTQVMKRAHREGLVQEDAGRDVRIHYVATKSRALTVEQLRKFLALVPELEGFPAEAMDFFRLSFYLRAINPADLVGVRPDDIFNGRLTYTRRKTGKDYSVKVEPEAQEIIDARGDCSRIWSPGIGREYRNYLQDIDDVLRRLAKGAGLPPVTMYWARHTFATLMIEAGIQVELVAAALGHSYGPRVTMGYVTIREKQVDDAVRKLYDYVSGTWEPQKN